MTLRANDADRTKTPMRILMLCGDFFYLSGSPLYVYTLAKELVAIGHHVTVCSNIGGVITAKAREAGIEVVSEIAIGDTFDVIHLHQARCVRFLEHATQLARCPAVFTCHSEFPSQKPLVDSRVRRYIAIRPGIAEAWGIQADIVYNPVDFSRFHPMPKPEEDLTLFVGTVDKLRRQAALQLLRSGKKCRFVGRKFDTYVDGLPNWCDETWNIEEHLMEASETAGILLGRTTIEGWACGRPGLIYDIDRVGNVVSVAKHDPPKDMSRFDSKIVARQIEEIYLRYCT
jgi:hypothetical protein